jgi:hypothetical protein
VKVVKTIVIATALCAGLYVTGCQTSHSESDKQGIFGGHKHEETTTTKNPITGDVSTDHKEVKTN